jgi:2-desacetyl-2-hydroxyethyl bacteriochlorophyllide A dehydrogenase
MRAAVVEVLPATSLALVEVEAPRPATGELLVQVEACGICGTDLHILEGSSYRPELPFVLGHEPVGRVTGADGPLAAEWIGRRVTLTLFEGCGVCAQCLRGDERLCPNLRSVRGVLNAAGGFAELMTVPAGQAVEIPERLSSVDAAALVDAGATAMNAAEVIGELGSASAVVVGGGPVGFLLAEILRTRGVETLVVEPRDRRREALRSLGHRVAEGLDAVTAPAPVIADCSGAGSVFSTALELLAPRGALIVVGYAHLAGLDPAPIARKELTVRGIRSGSRAHLEMVLRLAEQGAIRLPAVSTWPMNEINDAFEALREGRVAGKAVVVNPETAKESAWTS